MVPVHEPRFLVPECSALSVIGDPGARAAAGLHPDALVALITPLARFEPSRDGLTLTELTSGVTVAQLAELTGFEVRPGASVAERAPLDEQERAVLAELRAASHNNSRKHGSPVAG
jgi:hypothetical protein